MPYTANKCCFIILAIIVPLKFDKKNKLMVPDNFGPDMSYIEIPQVALMCELNLLNSLPG